MTGKAEIRNRAAPIGTSVTVSTASSDRTGLSCNTAHKPWRSSVHSGIRFALAVIVIGAASVVNGKSLAGQ